MTAKQDSPSISVKLWLALWKPELSIPGGATMKSIFAFHSIFHLFWKKTVTKFCGLYAACTVNWEKKIIFFFFHTFTSRAFIFSKVKSTILYVFPKAP